MKGEGEVCSLSVAKPTSLHQEWAGIHGHSGEAAAEKLQDGYSQPTALQSSYQKYLPRNLGDLTNLAKILKLVLDTSKHKTP